MNNEPFDLRNTYGAIKMLIRAVEAIDDNIMITSKDGTIQYVNPAFQRTTGYKKLEVIGQNPRILQSGQHDQAYYEKLWHTILSGKTFKSETSNRKKNGDLYIADQTISPIKADDGEISHFVSVWRDKTETLRLEEELSIERERIKEISRKYLS